VRSFFAQTAAIAATKGAIGLGIEDTSIENSRNEMKSSPLYSQSVLEESAASNQRTSFSVPVSASERPTSFHAHPDHALGDVSGFHTQNNLTYGSDPLSETRWFGYSEFEDISIRVPNDIRGPEAQQEMYPNVFRPAGIPRPSPVLQSVQTGLSPVYYSPQLMDTMPYPHPLQHMSPYYYPIQNNNLMPVQHHGSLPMNAYLPSPAPAYLSPIPSPFQTPSPQFYTPGSSPMDCMQIQPTLSPMYYPYPIAPGYRMEVPRGGIYVPTEYIGSSYASNRVFHGSDDTAVSPHYHQRLHDQVIILT